MIKVNSEKPSCWDRLEKEFGVDWDSGIIVTYGGQIYTKTGSLTPDFMVHELVHVAQQEGCDPDAYLEAYINDPQFRKNNETVAFQIQMQFLRNTILDKNLLQHKAEKLLKGMLKNYGGIFTKEEAITILGL